MSNDLQHELKLLRLAFTGLQKRLERHEEQHQQMLHTLGHIREDLATLRELSRDAIAGTAKATAALDSVRVQGEEYRKRERPHNAHLRQQVAAIVRALFVAPGLPAPESLQARRFSLRSSGEGDGILLAILAATDVKTRTLVDLGCGRNGGACAVLAYELGWSGLMVDAKPASVAALAADLPHVTVQQAMLTPENVNAIVQAGVGGEVDALSIDIDSVDYWLLAALNLDPRVLVVEYNAYFGSSASVTVPRDFQGRIIPEYFGASLTAFATLAGRKGYDLVLCDDAGHNAFFVRRDLAPNLPRLTPQQAYRPIRDRRPTTPEELVAICQAQGLPLVPV